MKLMPIKMRCPEYFTELKVYCYVAGDTVLPNGCDQFHPCNTCYDCCKKAVQICEEKLRSDNSNFPLHKP